MIKTKKQLQELALLDGKPRRACGNGLLAVRDPRSKKGGVYFVGKMQRRVPGKPHPVTKECQIGVWGSKPGQFTLAAAHTKWTDIKQWSLDEDRDPGDFWKVQKQAIQEEVLLSYLVERFLEKKSTEIKPTTLREYRLKLHQVMQVIPGSTPVRSLEWKNGGRKVVMDAIDVLGADGKGDLARRCQELLKHCFNLAVSRQWMGRGENPAVRLKGDDSPTSTSRHHPSVDWEQVPELLKQVSLNRSGTHSTTVAATKLLLLTFLRAGTLSRLEWDWINKEVITIPGDTPGLKRQRGKSDDIPHLVPITPEIQAVLDQMERLHGRGRYVFPQIMQSQRPHLNPSAPNNYLTALGYKGIQRAHGWRRVARTYGVDVLKAREVVIERQMGHLPKGACGKAYDGAQYLDERLEFLRNWGQVLVQQGLSI